MGMISTTGLGDIVVSHYQSLVYDDRGARPRPWPWITIFIALPIVGTAALAWRGFGPVGAAGVGLLAGVGVLGGLLFQVLAWISGRLGAIADATSTSAPTAHEVDLIARLDIARTNIAYAALVSVVFVVELGVVVILDAAPAWISWVSAFLMFHLAATLVLVILRINAIGQTDRVAALTRHARERSKRHHQGAGD